MLPDDLPVELQLLLLCGRQQPNEAQREKVRHLATKGEIDWSDFIRQAQRHRVVPHAYLVLSRAVGDQIPESTLEHLRRLFVANLRKNLMMAGELANICRRFNVAGIPVMVFKGPALSIQAYGGLQYRQFRDLDIMVPPQNVVDATKLLNALGYCERATSIASLSSSQRKRLTNLHTEAEFVNESRRVAVDMHWRLTFHHDMFAICPDRLWNSSRQIVLTGGRFHVLPQLEQIVFLALHGSTHYWKRLSWLFDLLQALESTPQLDWNELLDAASQLGAKKHFALGLRILQSLTDADFGSNSPGPLSENGLRLDRAAEISYHAMLSHEMHYHRQRLNAFAWAWRLSSGLRPKASAFFSMFTPHIKYVHLSRPVAYLKQLWHLGKRSQECLFSSVVKGAD